MPDTRDKTIANAYLTIIPHEYLDSSGDIYRHYIEKALEEAGRSMAIREYVISLDGEIL